MREERLVNFVHGCEIGHVVEEYIDLNSQELLVMKPKRRPVKQQHPNDSNLYPPMQITEKLRKTRTKTYLNNPIHPNPSLCQNGLNIITALLCFLSNVAFNQLALDVCGDLTRYVDLLSGDDCLALKHKGSYVN